ncbi:MAG TPA: excinuclease ABC subunit UvrC [Burkholderiales bacterium]|jgi:excinuclease ABC subunit C|nr:excinuclease ABC subunit UvrC [Burkholderiales bacterium]
MKSNPEQTRTAKPAFDQDEVLASLPHLPGVYRMLNATGEVLYVGKARDLKKRVASYFQKTGSLAPRIQLMMTQVDGLETTVTRSEAEALLLENNLIKSLYPRYNILYRDDKSYPYLVLTGHRFPRLGFHRGTLDKAHRYFGPFSNAGAVRESIQLMQKIFRLRTCEDTVFANRSRPCLLYQIKRCTGPCVGLIGETDYAEDVKSTELFLQGREDEAIERLEERMHRAAAQQAYEQAAAYRDQIRSLSKVRETQFVTSSRGVDADIVALAATGGLICVNLVMVRGGIHRGDKSFFPQNAQEQDEQMALEAFLTQHYVNREVPPTIIVNRPVEAVALEELLSQQAGNRVQVNANPTGERRIWLRMAEKNAELAIAQRLAAHATQETRLTALQQALGLADNVRRIECFDISHTMGEATVASCVVYDNSAMQTGEYRRYNINGVDPGDDYGAMRQVLDRRYRKIVEGEGKLPDLILIDGGKGQVSTAFEVLGELGLSDLPMIGVAKGEERKAGLEQLFFPDRNKPLRLAPDHPGLHLIQQVRDEAHRFAISGHRSRRARARNRSTLEEIDGIGVKRRQRLLSRFGGLKGVASASVEELAQVEGISTELAEKIYQQLH